MQIAHTQPQTLMLSQYVAQNAHQALLGKTQSGDSSETEAATAKAARSSVNPSNSLDILV